MIQPSPAEWSLSDSLIGGEWDVATFPPTGQAQRRLDNQRDDHRHKEQTPNFLKQRGKVASLVIDASEIKSLKQLGNASIGQHGCLIFTARAVERQQSLTGGIDSALKRE